MPTQCSAEQLEFSCVERRRVVAAFDGGRACSDGGALLLNGAPVSVAELEAQLQAAKARDPQMTVAIKGDARTQYAAVVAVIDLCNRLAVNMGLVTARIGT